MQFVVTFLCFFALIALVVFLGFLLLSAILRHTIHSEWPNVPDNKTIGKENYLGYHIIKVQGDEKYVKKMLKVKDFWSCKIDYPKQGTYYAIASPSGRIMKYDIEEYSWQREKNDFYQFIEKYNIQYHLCYKEEFHNYVVAYDKEEDAIKVLEWLRAKYRENIIYKTCEDTRNKIEIVY